MEPWNQLNWFDIDLNNTLRLLRFKVKHYHQCRSWSSFWTSSAERSAVSDRRWRRCWTTMASGDIEAMESTTWAAPLTSSEQDQALLLKRDTISILWAKKILGGLNRRLWRQVWRKKQKIEKMLIVFFHAHYGIHAQTPLFLATFSRNESALSRN